MSAVDAEAGAPPQEIEAKFRVTDPEQAERLLAAPALAGRYLLGRSFCAVNVDTYYDAADLRLLRAGRTLRTRVESDRVVMTSKSIGLHTPKGIHTRDEVEEAAPGLEGSESRLEVGQLPPGVAAQVADLLETGTALLPLARLRQGRTKRMVAHEDPDATGGALAELSLDEVSVERFASGQWEHALSFTELEIELEPGADRSALKELVQAVRSLPGLVVNDQNKLQQALAAIARLPTLDSPTEHHLHVAELCRRIWREQLAHLLLNEAGVRFSDDIEYVHDMRVSTRRARAAALLYAGYFDPKSKQIRRFERRLRTTGRLLGRVRDLDVALVKLERYAEEAGATEDEGIAILRQRWQRARDKAHATLLEWLDSRRYARFIEQFSGFCNTPGAAVPTLPDVPGRPPLPHQVRHVIPSMIMGCYEVIRAFEVLFEQHAAGGPPVPIETLHALRIECKYLRYHLEFNAALLGPEGDQLIAALKALQEHLGDLNDASVSRAILDAAGKQARSPAVEAYVALQVATITDLAARLPADLARFLSEETRRALALALARI